MIGYYGIKRADLTEVVLKTMISIVYFAVFAAIQRNIKYTHMPSRVSGCLLAGGHMGYMEA